MSAGRASVGRADCFNGRKIQCQKKDSLLVFGAPFFPGRLSGFDGIEKSSLFDTSWTTNQASGTCLTTS
eukprot:scaffold476_cov120-Cylindrotheca_fusiformis.AAC.3